MAIQSQVHGRSLEGGRTQVVYEAVEARQVMVHWRVLRPIEVRLQTPNPVWWFCCRPNTRWSTFKDSDPDRWIPPGIYSDEGQKKLQSSGCRRSLFRAVSRLVCRAISDPTMDLNLLLRTPAEVGKVWSQESIHWTRQSLGEWFQLSCFLRYFSLIARYSLLNRSPGVSLISSLSLSWFIAL